MQNRTVVSIFVLAAGLAFSGVAFAQESEYLPSGWKACPQCQSPQDKKEAEKYKPEGMPFSRRDLSGVWGSENRAGQIRGPLTVFLNPPPLTPWGKQRHEATLTEFTPAGQAISNWKDPNLICDPQGWPRMFSYNYGFEFVTLPDRVLQFFDMGHTWRTIYTDGRKLPENPPVPRFMGWAVGRWEEDTFVVESNGYDDRSWIEKERREEKTGWPHSDEMRIVERWTRTSYGNLDAQVTIIDPKTYTQPWVTSTVKHSLQPNTEIWEYFCVPSESEEFNRRLTRPAAGAAPE